MGRYIQTQNPVNGEWLMAMAQASANASNTVNALCEDGDTIDVVLNNAILMATIGNSGTAFTAINGSTNSVTIGKWIAYKAGLNPADYANMTAVAASSTAMNAVAASSTAMNAIVASSTARTAVIASNTAMTAVSASSTARTVIDASSTTVTEIKAKTSAYLRYYSSSLSLVLPMEGANNSTTFTDISASPKSITRNGDAKISTTQSKWGYGSAYFDGTGDYLTIASVASLVMGSSDFTKEFWIYPTGVPLAINSLISKRATDGFMDMNLAISSSGNLQAYISGGSLWNIVSNTNICAIPLNTWTHIALVRNGSSWNIYKGGVSQLNWTSSLSVSDDGSAFAIGCGSATGDQPYTGYIQDLIVAKVARYTSNFTPPERINA